MPSTVVRDRDSGQERTAGPGDETVQAQTASCRCTCVTKMREEGTLVRLEQRKVLSEVSTNIARFSLLYFVFFLKLPNESSTNAYNKQINNNNNQIVSSTSPHQSSPESCNRSASPVSAPPSPLPSLPSLLLLLLLSSSSLKLATLPL